MYNGADVMFLFKDGLSLIIDRLSFNYCKNILFSCVRIVKSSKDAEWLQNSMELFLGLTSFLVFWIRAKVSLTLQNSKPHKDNLSKDECKALKELQSDTSIVILPADKGRSAVILNREDCLEKCIDHIKMVYTNYLKKILLPKLKPRH